MKKYMMTLIIAWALVSCSYSNKAYNTAQGAWISSEVSEKYVDDYHGTIENSYDFRSALVIINNEFMWDHWGEYGNYRLENNGDRLRLSFNDEECPGRCAWELVSYSSNELTFQKIEGIVGTDYNTTITFNRL